MGDTSLSPTLDEFSYVVIRCKGQNMVTMDTDGEVTALQKASGVLQGVVNSCGTCSQGRTTAQVVKGALMYSLSPPVSFLGV